MNRLLNASLLSVLAVASLGTVACTAETAESNAPVAATTQSPAELLAGEGGTQTGTVKGYSTGQTITSGKAKLVVDDVSYDLLSYSFGISNHQAGLSGGTAERSTGKAALAELAITVRPSATEAVLRKAVFDGVGHKASIFLFPTAEAGMTAPKPIELAVFEEAHVSAVATGAGSGAVESYSIAFGKVSLQYAGVKVGYDMMHGTVDHDGACAMPEGVLPAYTQANAGELTKYPLLPGATRIDSVSVGVSNVNTIGSGTTGASSGKAQLDGITVASTLEKGGMCSFLYSAAGVIVPTAKIGVAGAVSAKLVKPFEAITWTACTAAVESVQISSSGEGAPIQVMQLQAGGLLRTDRSIDPTTQKMVEASNGWSFVNNVAVKSCAEVVAF